MEGRPRFGLGKKPPNKSTDNAANDPEERGHEKSHTLCARHHGARDQTDNETNNNVPNDV